MVGAAVMEEADSRDHKTVVVSGVPDVLPVSRIIDKLTIHFQSCRKSCGGDVVAVKYPTNMDGVAFVTFEQAKEQYELLADAERVIRKEQQIMTDKEFSAEYLLTVFPFTPDVFLYITSATVDLSIFGDEQAPLIRSLRAAHRSVRFQPSLQQRKAIIEGPFAAVRALREDLYRRAGRLKPIVSAQAAAVELKETVNPRPISRPEHFSSGSGGGDSEANWELVHSKCLSTPLQAPGEAEEVKSPSSYAKAQISTIPRVPDESLVAGRLHEADANEKEPGVQSGFGTLGSERVIAPDDMRSSQSSAEYGTKRAAEVRQVFREPEIKAEIGSSLSGPVWLPAEATSSKQPGVDGISQNHAAPDRISATETRGGNHSGSRSSGTDYLMESDQSSSAVAAKLFQSRLPDVSMSQEMNAEATGDLSDKCVWVDSDTFRYIKRFDGNELDRCLRGHDVSVNCVEGTDLTQVLLTGKGTPAAAVRRVSEELQSLVEVRQLVLRVHRVHFDCEEQPEQQKLAQICDEVNFLFDDVLYILEEGSIKVIGPSVSSFLFQKRVKDRITKLKDTFL